ncbi:MerR family transcriptional regulator [Actinomadura sp. 21ATH]|uniref:MerR family transcriptional regulator n=1 Tax=Actinomadura sp. 21ATH TaxID=1735444 RepID=UPI0035BFFF87
MESTWTIAELAERAVEALSAGDSVQVNGRVRDMPNERLIRWYTTIGLVDPPSGRRGRTALYGPRHLRQLVAVKRRQAEGRTIAQIQAELAGATDTHLSRIAALPAPGPAPAAAPPPLEAPAAAPSLGRSRFWTPAAAPSTAAPTSAFDGGGAVPRPPVVQGVRLADGLTLLLDVPALGDDDLAAITAAAGPLLEELRRRGLIEPASPPPPETPPTEALPTDMAPPRATSADAAPDDPSGSSQ